MSRIRDIKRQARGDVHREASVPALYIATSGATPTPCNIRLWLKTDNHMVGDLPGFPGAATAAEPEDRVRIDLAEISAPAKPAIFSVEVGEAYRIELLYPADNGYQTARVTRLSAAQAQGLPVPE